MEDNLKRKMEDDLKKMEYDLKHNFKKSTLIGCNIILD